MITSTLNINAVYGEIARDVALIDDIDTLQKIKKYVVKLLYKKQQEELKVVSKEEILADLTDACKEVKAHKEGNAELLSFDDMLESL